MTTTAASLSAFSIMMLSLFLRTVRAFASSAVMSRDDYIKEGIWQLSDANFYVKLDYDPTPNHIDEIHYTLLKALQRDEITKKIFEFLVPTDCTTPARYFLPKIHKEKITARPIISGNNSPTEKISAFVDEHIKMMVPLIPSYVRDTPDFIKRIVNFSHRGDFYTFPELSLEPMDPDAIFY